MPATISARRWFSCALTICVFCAIGEVTWGQDQCEKIAPQVIVAIEESGDQPASKESVFDSNFVGGEFKFETKIESLENQIDPLEDQDPRANSRIRIEDLVQKPINQIGLSLWAELHKPQLKQVPHPTQNSSATVAVVKDYQWTASNEFYRNLMFEEPLLERHGIYDCPNRPGLQPVISGFKFLKSGFLFPLEAAKGYHKRCDNPLGWGVPGNYCR